jgi:hypothetical protein
MTEPDSVTTAVDVDGMTSGDEVGVEDVVVVVLLLVLVVEVGVVIGDEDDDFGESDVDEDEMIDVTFSVTWA